MESCCSIFSARVNWGGIRLVGYVRVVAVYRWVLMSGNRVHRTHYPMQLLGRNGEYIMMKTLNGRYMHGGSLEGRAQ